MSLQIDNDRGRWKNFDPRLDPVAPATEMTSSKVPPVGKLTFRIGLFNDVVDDVSSDIPKAL